MTKHWRVRLDRLDKYVEDFTIKQGTGTRWVAEEGNIWEIDGLNSLVTIMKQKYTEQGECYHQMDHSLITHWRIHKLYSRREKNRGRSPLRFPRHLFASLMLKLYSQMDPSDKIAVDCDPSDNGNLRRMYENMGFKFVAYGPMPLSRVKHESECLMVTTPLKLKEWCLRFRQDTKVYVKKIKK